MNQPFNPQQVTQAPLRNRVCVQLNATPEEVWALIGDLGRFPEYSAGLDQVHVTNGNNGHPIDYTCQFKPMEPGGESISSREIIQWWQPGIGYASRSAGGDAFGLKNDLNLVTISATADGSVVTWEEYFDAEDAEMMQAHFAQALADIAENLARTFGGRVIERYP